MVEPSVTVGDTHWLVEGAHVQGGDQGYDSDNGSIGMAMVGTLVGALVEGMLVEPVGMGSRAAGN